MEHEGQDFSVYHRGELREALIMLEGSDGSFELLSHGSATRPGGDTLDWASVRSSGSDAEYLLIHDDEHHPGRTCWHLADPSETAVVRSALFRS